MQPVSYIFFTYPLETAYLMELYVPKAIFSFMTEAYQESSNTIFFVTLCRCFEVEKPWISLIYESVLVLHP